MRQAVEANPYAGAFIAFNGVFTKHCCNPTAVEEMCGDFDSLSLEKGTVDEAFLYCTDGLSLWLDAEGSTDFLLQHWGELA